MTTPSSFGPIQVTAVILAAIVAGCVPALQPILLGGLLDAHRITADQIGQAATIEALGMVLATALAGALLQPKRLRAIATIAALTMIVANGVTPYIDASGIFVARFCNGAASGMILWILVGLLSRAARPGQLFAVYVTAQSVLAFALSSLMTAVLVPHWGVSGGYLSLLVLGGATLLLAGFVPAHYDTHAGAAVTKRPTISGGAGLIAVMLFMAGIFSIWIYVAPLAKQLGHATTSIGTAISMAIGIQIVGGLAATRLADKWNGATTTAIAAAIAGISVLSLLYIPQPWVLYAATSAISFVWMFTPSFHMPMILKLDPSGNSAIFISTAQLGGVALGPLAASMAITGDNFTGAAFMSMGLFACCMLMLGGIGIARTAQPTLKAA